MGYRNDNGSICFKRKDENGFMKKQTGFFLSIMLSAAFLLTACSQTNQKEIPPSTVHSLQDLPGKTVGVLTDSQSDLYATDLELPASGEEPCIINRYDSLEEGITELEKGDLDCMIMEADAAQSYCDSHDQLAVLEEAFVWQEYTMCLPAFQSSLLETINQNLALMEEEGELSRISQSYQNPDASSKHLSFSSQKKETDSSLPLLRVATCAGFEPYVYYNSKKELTGIDIETVLALAKRLQVRIQITEMDYDAMFTALSDGSADLAIGGISPSEEVSDTCLFTDSYANECQMVLTRK